MARLISEDDELGALRTLKEGELTMTCGKSVVVVTVDFGLSVLLVVFVLDFKGVVVFELLFVVFEVFDAI